MHPLTPKWHPSRGCAPPTENSIKIYAIIQKRNPTYVGFLFYLLFVITRLYNFVSSSLGTPAIFKPSRNLFGIFLIVIIA